MVIFHIFNFKEKLISKMADKGPLFLGFDLSTQQLKAVVTDINLCIRQEESVHFDKDLAEFQTNDGVVRHKDGLTVTVPTLLWVKAFDLLLEKLKKKGFRFENVVSVSGSGQQHGSVYWRFGAREKIRNLNPENTLFVELKDVFVLQDSPIWMDSSTTAQCHQLEHAVGGAQQLANITGSRAYERFTGNQIAKVYQTQQSKYEQCECISLVSSFLASLCRGDYAPIDFSDGSGMNLMNIHTKNWEPTCLETCAPNLKEKLIGLVPSCETIGSISPYLCERYGFSEQCQVVAFTGDNPASLVGVRLKKGDVCISLGTSDTLMFWLNTAKPQLGGHIFVNPINEDAYMALLCFKNGSLVREDVCNRCANRSWQEFENSLERSAIGNNGNIGIYFQETEILPFAKGTYRFDKYDNKVESFSKDEEIRAVVEGQFLAKRLHAETFGYFLHPNTSILATGGASTNKAMLQILSDVFDAPVYTISSTANSACLGAAYQAKYGWTGSKGKRFEQIFTQSAGYHLAVEPIREHTDIYDEMLTRYKKLEELILVKK